MGIDARIPMSRKMLGCSRYAFLLISLDRSYTQGSYRCGIFTKGTYPDDRVARIVIHIQAWSKVHIHSERTKLTCSDLGDLVGIFDITGRAKCHIAWYPANAS